MVTIISSDSRLDDRLLLIVGVIELQINLGLLQTDTEHSATGVET